MKKGVLVVIGALVALVMLLGTASAILLPIEKGPNGQLSVGPHEPTGDFVDSAVLVYGDAWEKAYRSGSMEIVKSHEQRERDGLFYVTKSEVVDVGIVWSKYGTHLVRDVVTKSTSVFNPYLIVIAIAAGCLLGGFHKKSNLFFFIATVAAGVEMMGYAESLSLALFGCVTITMIAAAAAIGEKRRLVLLFSKIGSLVSITGGLLLFFFSS